MTDIHVRKPTFRIFISSKCRFSSAYGLSIFSAARHLGTETGRYRSSRIVPEPFFVHSDLTTGVFLADLAAYILGWGWRLGAMEQASRSELKPYADKLHEMQFVGQKPEASGERAWPLYGIKYLDDLRGQFDRDQTG